jgi:MFS family permease
MKLNLNNEETELFIENKLTTNKPKDLKLIDQIICNYGYGFNNITIILGSIFIISVSGYYTTFFSTTVLAYQHLYNFADEDLMHIATIFYILKILGSVTVGQMTARLGRYNIIITSLLILTINNILSAFNEETKSYIYLNRIITGYFSGCIETVVTNILCEYLPLDFRGFILTFVWTGWSLGQILPNIIMLYTMPKYEVAGLSETKLLCTIIPLNALVFCLFFFDDSPRSYIFNNHTDKGLKILKRFTNKKFTDEDKAKLISEIQSGVNKNTDASVFELFNKEYLLLTFIILFLNFISNMLYDGFSFIISFTLNDINKSENVLWDAIQIIAFSIPSCLFAGIITEVKYFGRKFCNFMGYILLIISIVLAISFPAYISIFFGFYYIFICFGNIVIITYTSEIYPTKIRDLASSMGFVSANTGSMLSQICYFQLHKISTLAPFWFTLLVSILCAVLSYMLPYETYHRPLDSSFVEEDNKNNKL